MSTSGARSESGAADVLDPQHPEPPVLLSSEQRKALVHICQIHEKGLNPRWFSRRSLLVALYIAFTLAFSVLLRHMTAFASPCYLLLGFMLGGLLNYLRILVNLRRIWPVYEAIIDWPKACQLLKNSGETSGRHRCSRHQNSGP